MYSYVSRRSHSSKPSCFLCRLSITTMMLSIILLMISFYWCFNIRFGSTSYSLDHNHNLRHHNKGKLIDINDPLIHYNSSGLKNKLLLWSSDFHISPIADIKDLLMNDVLVIDKSLSGHCHLTNTCENDLRILTKLNGIKLSPCPNQLKRDFYNSYRSDPLLNSMDAFICTHAASLCELFMPFKKPLVVIASTRYEIGRLEKDKWLQWNENLRRIASNRFNTIAANNRYDQEYIKYFTGIENVLLLPNICGYTKVHYKPTRPEFLLAPVRGVNSQLQNELFSTLLTFNHENNHKNSNNMDIKISPIRDLYHHFMFRDLAAHPLIVILPYQVSFMSFFEYYRMQIPMLVPSPALLTDWHLKYHVLNERTWMSVYGMPGSKSVIERHPNYRAAITGNVTHIDESSSTAHHHQRRLQMMLMNGDPNDEYTRSSILEWVSLADFYQWPHIKQFDSWSHLFELLDHMRKNNAELQSISKLMGIFNKIQENDTKQKWNNILDKIYTSRNNNQEHNVTTVALPNDINQALSESYGFSLSTEDCNRQNNSIS